MWVPIPRGWAKFWCDAYDHMVSRGLDLRKASANAGKMLAHHVLSKAKVVTK